MNEKNKKLFVNFFFQLPIEFFLAISEKNKVNPSEKFYLKKKWWSKKTQQNVTTILWKLRKNVKCEINGKLKKKGIIHWRRQRTHKKATKFIHFLYEIERATVISTSWSKTQKSDHFKNSWVSFSLSRSCCLANKRQNRSELFSSFVS